MEPSLTKWNKENKPADVSSRLCGRSSLPRRDSPLPQSSSDPYGLDAADVDAQTVAGETGTLGKAVALLDLVARADNPPRFTDLLKLTGQPRGSLHRQLRHLVLEGLIDLSPDGGYTPGLRLLQFASRAWARNSFRLVAEPHLTHLHEMTGETVHLGVLRDCEIVYLDKIESRQAVRMHSQVVSERPRSPVLTMRIFMRGVHAWPSMPIRRERLAVRRTLWTISQISAPAALPSISKSISRAFAAWQPPFMRRPPEFSAASRSPRRLFGQGQSSWRPGPSRSAERPAPLSPTSPDGLARGADKSTNFTKTLEIGN
jgi:hypothetical protein